MDFDIIELKADKLRKQSLTKPHWFIPQPCSHFCRCGAPQYDEIHFKNGIWLSKEEISRIYGVSM
jgi:hypothetical protein